ncbi:hypothetical protein D3C84_935170 [compost metagenome]
MLELDRDIDQRFETLRAERAEQAEALARIRGNYQFVRAQLLQDKGRAHGGVEFYLSRAVADLDELAITTLATDAGQGSLQPSE